MNDFNTQYKKRIEIIDDYMKKRLGEFAGCESELFSAMEYAVFNGGKRIRSILCIETAAMLSGSFDNALPFAAAIELIHAFSLVHDDLPSMDNADFRRGMPSCHKKFGEAMALLAGDALLNTAYEIMLSECDKKGAGALRAMRHIAACAGVNGMINGQARDLALSENIGAGEEELIALIEQKTMALIMTSVISGAYAAGADSDTISALREFAYSLGIAFQIRDDFEDEAEDMQAGCRSPNFINVLGREAALSRMESHVERARRIIDGFENNDFIMGLTDYLFN